MLEIVVRGQKRQVVPQAQSRQQRVDGAGLNPGAAAGVSDFGGGDMVFTIRQQQRQCRKPFNDLFARFRALKILAATPAEPSRL